MTDLIQFEKRKLNFGHFNYWTFLIVPAVSDLTNIPPVYPLNPDPKDFTY